MNHLSDQTRAWRPAQARRGRERRAYADVLRRWQSFCVHHADAVWMASQDMEGWLHGKCRSRMLPGPDPLHQLRQQLRQLWQEFTAFRGE